MIDFNSILKNIQNSQGSELGDHLYDLTKIIKMYECEPILDPLKDALPELAKYLNYDDEWNSDGCAISIFRRIPISKKTLNVLMQLEPSSLVIEAIGEIDASLWNNSVEEKLSKALLNRDTAYAAIRALYRNTRSIQLENTVHKIAKSTLSKDQLVASLAITAMVKLFKGKLKITAKKYIQEFEIPVEEK